MLRFRTVVPILLLSSFANPAFGESSTSHCASNAMSPRCEAERAREFAKARNAEINASIAAVMAARAELALSMTHCKTPGSATPRCEAERARELALARTHCKTPDSTTPRCQAQQAREFAAARNVEINASIAAVTAERTRAFAAARNVEINTSIAAVKAERARAFAADRNAEINASIATVTAEHARAYAAARGRCTTPDSTTPRCLAQQAREFAAARNAEINASIAAVTAERARVFAAARNAEINASIAAVEAARARTFAADRNAEINASIAAVAAERALRLAIETAKQTRLETGAISLPETPSMTSTAPVVRRARHGEPCREAGRLMGPLQFSDGNAEIEQAMKPELDRIAMMAQICPAIRIEIHGYSDNAAPSQINRHLAQRRAQAAVEYLVRAGVDQNRLAAIGHAEGEPLAPNTSEENRALNRRIEITINDPATQAAAQRVMWDLAELLDPTYVPPLARLSP